MLAETGWGSWVKGAGGGSGKLLPSEPRTTTILESAVSLRVHVPHYCILGPQSPYIGDASRPKYSLFKYMDPQG